MIAVGGELGWVLLVFCAFVVVLYLIRCDREEGKRIMDYIWSGCQLQIGGVRIGPSVNQFWFGWWSQAHGSEWTWTKWVVQIYYILYIYSLSI